MSAEIKLGEASRFCAGRAGLAALSEGPRRGVLLIAGGLRLDD